MNNDNFIFMLSALVAAPELEQLRADGFITQAEYQERRLAILDEI